MKTGFLCALAKLRKNKIPSLLLGICICIAAALLVNAFVLLQKLDTIFDRAYEEMNGPQLCGLWSQKSIPLYTVTDYLDCWKENISYQITENTKTIDYIEKNGKKLSNGILLELPGAIEKEMLSPKMLDQKKIREPGKNEIWITTKIANILGLEIGDDLILQLAGQTVPVKVVEIVADPVFGSSGTNIYRMWCGHGRLADFPMAENNEVSYLEIKFHQYDRQMEKDFINGAEAYFDMPLADTLYTYDRIKGGYTASYRLVGAMLLFVSIILTGTIVALTLFLVKGDIDENVRDIGIYKSLGMTGIQIASIYLICYGIIGGVWAVLGSMLGGWFNKSIIKKILWDIGIHKVSFSGSGKEQILAAVIILAFVMTICICNLYKVLKLSASHAIRTGSWQRKEKVREESGTNTYNGKAPFELYYALRGMRNKKCRYAFIACISMIFGCLLISGLGCLKAVANIDEDPEVWGFIKTDIYVTSTKNKPVSTIVEELEKDPRVQYTYGVNKGVTRYKPKDREAWQNIVTEIYEMPWKNEGKDRSLYGRRPVKENEVGVGLSLAKTYGLEVGQKIDLMVNGSVKTYEVTGIFQTLSNYGNIFRMVTNDLDRMMEAGHGFGDYMVVLSKNVDKWEYAKELTKKYGGDFSFIASKSNGENITGVLVPAIGFILAILFLIVILVTTDLTFLLIRREKRLIGFFRAVGMTPWQILRIYSWRNCLSAFVGNSLGIAFGILAVPGLLTPYSQMLGITMFPFSNSLVGMATGFVLLPLCMLLGTCTMVNTLKNVEVAKSW